MASASDDVQQNFHFNCEKNKWLKQQPELNFWLHLTHSGQTAAGLRKFFIYFSLC